MQERLQVILILLVLYLFTNIVVDVYYEKYISLHILDISAFKWMKILITGICTYVFFKVHQKYSKVSLLLKVISYLIALLCGLLVVNSVPLGSFRINVAEDYHVKAIYGKIVANLSMLGMLQIILNNVGLKFLDKKYKIL